jgi:hypothetical protein
MKLKNILMICCWSVCCYAGEHALQDQLSQLTISNKRKRVHFELPHEQQNQQSKKHQPSASTVEKISPIRLGGRMLDLLGSLFPSVLVQIMFEYSGCEDGDFIAYFDPQDGSYTRTNTHVSINKKDLLSSATKIHVFGVNKNHLPVVRECQFSPESAEFSLSCYQLCHQLKNWDYAHIGDAVRRSFGEVRASHYFVDYTCRNTAGSNTDELFTECSKSSVSMMSFLLGNMCMAVCKKDSSEVQRGQKNSLLCGVPGMGPREFAQLLKNTALYFTSVRAKLPMQSFKEERPGYGDNWDAVVNRYSIYKPLLDRVINDETNSLALVFFNKNMTLAECMRLTPE